MRYQVIAVRDRAIAAYGQPQVMPTIGAGIRAFGDVVNGPKDSPIASHPEDFELFHLAEFDDVSGQFDNLETPRQIAIGKDLVRS